MDMIKVSFADPVKDILSVSISDKKSSKVFLLDRATTSTHVECLGMTPQTKLQQAQNEVHCDCVSVGHSYQRLTL